MKSNNLIYDIHWSFICYAFKITKGHLPYLFLCKHVFIIFFNCIKTFDTCMTFRFNCNGFTRYILYFWFNTLVQIHVPKDVYMLNNGLIPIKKSSYKEAMHSETETFSKWLRAHEVAVYFEHGSLFTCMQRGHVTYKSQCFNVQQEDECMSSRPRHSLI